MVVESLNVIALISGGKDSFYSILHCLHHGHRVVALANLHPPSTGDGGVGTTEDVNSFMYQTAGHQLIPLYASSTGIPLYRHPISGTAVQSGITYKPPPSSPRSILQTETTAPAEAHGPAAGLRHDCSRTIRTPEDPRRRVQHEMRQACQALRLSGSRRGPSDASATAMVDEDETESMTGILRAVLAEHPEANAVCAGAILSTYQRVRVESVATRLGLTPLAFLWKYPTLPPPSGNVSGPFAAPRTLYSVDTPGSFFPLTRQPHSPGAQPRKIIEKADPAQLLIDMANAGLSARIVKVASAGLDEGFLWEEVTSVRGIARLKKAIYRFGEGDGSAVIGEGGEFETVVIDGPSRLFKARLRVEDEAKFVVHEGGGCSWLGFTGGKLEVKSEVDLATPQDLAVREPPILDQRFRDIERNLLEHGLNPGAETNWPDSTASNSSPISSVKAVSICGAEQWVGMHLQPVQSPKEEAEGIIARFRDRLAASELPPSAVIGSLVLLRDMADFSEFNTVYGSLFPDPIPPSRVCVACGDMLPHGCNMAVYLSVLTGIGGKRVLECGKRLGLHVQSRSYWAPANIGPYSQGTSVPLLLSQCRALGPIDNTSWPEPEEVIIAGQIPLVPATMALSSPTENPLFGTARSLVLSLQHVWRIAGDLRVQWFVGAVAYVSRSSTDWTDGKHGIRKAALVAHHVWREVCLWNFESLNQKYLDEESQVEGPDVWDRKFGGGYQVYHAQANNGENTSSIPAWDMFQDVAESVMEDKTLSSTDTDTATSHTAPCVPSAFLAEVSMLPRSAPVEWHVPLCLRNMRPRSARFQTGLRGTSSSGWAWRAEHLTIELSPGGHQFIHSVVSVNEIGHADVMDVNDLGQELKMCWMASMRTSRDGGVYCGDQSNTLPLPYLTYIDERKLCIMASVLTEDAVCFPVVPCRSLYDGRGGNVAVVSFVRGVIQPTT